MTFFKRFFLLFQSIGSENTLGSSDELTDNALIEQILSTNNTLLFSKLYDRYNKKIYNKCYSFVKNEEEAKDLTQDVFLKLYMKLNTYKANAKFSTWLYSFTYNFCVNYKNRDRGRKLNELSDSIEDHDFYLASVEDVSKKELFKMQAAKLEQALDNLKPEDKALLLLKYQDETSIKDIQKVLDVSESAVKMRLKRARIKVFEEYKKIK